MRITIIQSKHYQQKIFDDVAKFELNIEKTSIGKCNIEGYVVGNFEGNFKVVEVHMLESEIVFTHRLEYKHSNEAPIRLEFTSEYSLDELYSYGHISEVSGEILRIDIPNVFITQINLKNLEYYIIQ